MRPRARFLQALAVSAIAAALTTGCGDSGTSGTVPVGEASAAARPSNTSAVPVTHEPIDPGQLYIPAIDVNAPMMSLPTEVSPDPFLGGKEVQSFGVPPDMTHTAWWSDGPKIGSDAMAVVLGHAQFGAGYGVFNHIKDLKAGDEITVESPDASQRVRFKVISVKSGISKRDPDALVNTLNAQPADARLALITCGGQADLSVMESDENVVVFAALA